MLSRMLSSKLNFALVIRIAAFGLTILFAGITARAATFNVNTAIDTQDALAGDGICADANGQCSFRAAISEANAFINQMKT